MFHHRDHNGRRSLMFYSKRGGLRPQSSLQNIYLWSNKARLMKRQYSSALIKQMNICEPLFVPMNNRPPAWSHKKIAKPNYGPIAGLLGGSWVRVFHHNARLGLGRFNYRLRGPL
jgi:hypothetical protein